MSRSTGRYYIMHTRQRCPRLWRAEVCGAYTVVGRGHRTVSSLFGVTYKEKEKTKKIKKNRFR